MAASVDAVSTAVYFSPSTTSFSWGHSIAPTANAIDIVFGGSVQGINGGTYALTGVTVGGVAATRVVTSLRTLFGGERWRLLKPPTGSVTIVATKVGAGYAPLAATAISLIGANQFTTEEDPGLASGASAGTSPFALAATVPQNTGDITLSLLVVDAGAYTSATTTASTQTERSSLNSSDQKVLVGTRTGTPPSTSHSYDLTANAAGREYLLMTWTVRQSGGVAWWGKRWWGTRWRGATWWGGTTNNVLIATGLEGTGEVGTQGQTRTLLPAGFESATELGTVSASTGGGWRGARWFGRTWWGRSWFGGPEGAGSIMSLAPTGVEGTGEIGTPGGDKSITPTGLEATGEGADATTRGIDLDMVPDGPEATGEIGTPGGGDKTLEPVGLEATGEEGTPAVLNVGQDLYPDGAEAQGEVSQPDLVIDIDIVGEEATGEVTDPTWDRTLEVVGEQAESEVGLPQTLVDDVVNLTPNGLEATGETTNPADDRILADILGLEATGEADGFIDVGKGFRPDGVEAGGEYGVPGVDTGGTLSLSPTGVEALGEQDAYATATLTPEGEEAVGEIHAFFTEIFGVVQLTDVDLTVPSMTTVTCGVSSLTAVEIR